MTNWVQREDSAKVVLQMEDKSNGTLTKPVIILKKEFLQEEAVAQPDSTANSILKPLTSHSMEKLLITIHQDVVECHLIE